MVVGRYVVEWIVRGRSPECLSDRGQVILAEVSYLADGDVGRLGRSAVIMTVGTREMVPVAMTGPHAGKQLGGRGA